jgi:myosin heavy subunit
MLAGLSAEERQEFGLRSPQDFFYLNQSGCINMPNINDAGTLKEVREAFLTLNFKKYEKQIFCALSAILHLGNISFVESFGQNMDGVAIKDPSGSVSQCLNTMKP